MNIPEPSVNSMKNLSLGANFPTAEEVVGAIQIAKERQNYEPLCKIVEEHFSKQEFFTKLKFPPEIGFKAVSCLAKSEHCARLRPQLQKCLQLVLRHCNSLLASPEESQFAQSKRDLCFQCSDGNYSINKRLFQFAFPEYYEAYTRFTNSSCQTNLHKQLSFIDGAYNSQMEQEDGEVPVRVASIEFLERWLLGTDYGTYPEHLEFENGLDLYCLGKEYLSSDLQQRAFDCLRACIGHALHTGKGVCRSPDWIIKLLAGVAISGAKTSPFFVRFRQEIRGLLDRNEVEGRTQQEQTVSSEIEERLMGKHIGSYDLFTKDEWGCIFDYQHLCGGQTFPLFRSRSDIEMHKEETSLEGALSRAILATYEEDPQVKICESYSSDIQDPIEALRNNGEEERQCCCTMQPDDFYGDFYSTS